MVRIKKLSLSMLFSLIAAASSLSAMEEITDFDFENATIEFSPSVTRSTGSDEKSRLLYDNAGFFVREKAKDVRVNGYDCDKFFEGKSVEDMARYSLIGKFKVSQFDNGEYAVRTCGELKGGGLGGATAGAWFGKAMVSVIGHGTILLIGGAISLVATPAGGTAFVIAAESTCGPMIEAASMAGAVGFGVIGGVATGPV